jgi:peptide deformylase
MSVLPLRYIPDPILRQKAQKVRHIDDPIVQQLIVDMIDSMRYYNGVGIAANQVGALQRICIIQLPDDESPRVLINLNVTRTDGEREVTEGCLSLPGYQGRITRSEKVWATAVDGEGKPLRLKGVTDLLAQALEHELDHLDGTLYLDLLQSRDDLWEVEIGSEEVDEGEGTQETSLVG